MLIQACFSGLCLMLNCAADHLLSGQIGFSLSLQKTQRYATIYIGKCS